MSNRLNWIATIIGAFLFALFAIHFLNYTPDDTFISLRYAENFAKGQGLVFNPGEKVEGYSNFLWVLLLSIFSNAGLGKAGLVTASKSLGILSGFATIFWITKAAWYLKVRFALQSFWGVAPLGFGLLVYPAFWSVSGMETGFYVMLVALAGWRYFRFCETRTVSNAILSSLAFAAVALTRPEGILFFFAAICAEGFLWVREKKAPEKNLLVWAVPILLLYTAYFLWRHSYYGFWLPNTFFAKTGGGFAKYADGLRYLILILPDILWSNPLLVLVVLLPAALWKTVGRPLAFLFFSVAGQCAFVVFAGGDWMPGARFLVPIAPAVCLLASFSLSWARLDYSKLIPMPNKKLLQAMLLVGLLAFTVMHLYSAKQVRHDLSGFSRYRIDVYFKDQRFAIAQLISRHAEPGALVAVGEAGLIPYLTELPILDMLGLTDPYLARLPGLLHQKFDADYVFSRKPEFIVLGGLKRRGDGTTSDFEYARKLLTDPRLMERYEVIREVGAFSLLQAAH